MFVVFILCNAIISGVSVWNYFIAQAIDNNLQVDAFVIAVGALGLGFIFPVVFVNLAGKTMFACRVWFECVWVGLFFALEFAAAIGLSAIVPSLLCTSSDVPVPQSCVSTQILLAFTWTIAIVLFGYFLLLFISSIVVAKTDPRIWQRAVRHFSYPDSTMPHYTESGTNLIEKGLNRRSKMSIVAPKPRRAAPASLYEFQYGIGGEGYNDPSTYAYAPRERVPIPPPPDVITDTRPQTAQWVRETSRHKPASLYPQPLQSTIASFSFPPYNPPSRVSRPLADLSPQPLPLGDWPRSDALSRPPRGRRHEHSTRSPTTKQRSKRNPPPTIEVPTLPPPAVVLSPSRSRPMGPRVRSQGGEMGRSRTSDYPTVNSFGERSRR